VNYAKVSWYKTSGHKIIDAMKKIAKSKEVKGILLASTKKLLEKVVQ
jgi:hypothetical protein